MQLDWDSTEAKPILTYSGILFYPLAPRVEDVEIVDIAHALSNLCRFGGHCREFYSVAEHSVLIARYVWKKTRCPVLALQAILHDGSEAYLVDMPRPIKVEIPQYLTIETAIQAVVMDAWDLPHSMPAFVKECDNAILLTERDQNLASDEGWWPDVEPLPVKLKLWSPSKARRIFIREFNQYWSAANG